MLVTNTCTADAQVLQTNRQISQAGKRVWRTTKEQTDRALDRPKRLLAMLNGGAKDADGSDEDVEGAALNTYRYVEHELERHI